MSHPYDTLPPAAFWRRAVAEPGADGIAGLSNVALPAKDEPVATFGSCFAQHIGRAFVERGYTWSDEEPAPVLLRPHEARAFGYGVFSARTANIYTPSMLNQWLDLAFGTGDVAGEVWHDGGRVFDPLRPMIEPGGFADENEFRAARHATLAALRRVVSRARLFVFTLGLTEHWVNAESGLEYALCPGTVPGAVFDPALHVFRNHRAASIRAELDRAVATLRSANPDIRVLLTVSPVPLVATASGQHVLTATSWSKSVLRAAAGELAEDDPGVDYFPSYEIITHPIFEGRFYAQNKREVTDDGVATVMRHFFGGEPPRKAIKAGRRKSLRPKATPVSCEEIMLDAFSS